ncbi:ABC transporter permease [Eubacteriales bacterium OttesenSCG-928-N14]|nr:ABC transporter permease [Eubacteriales bacterium OttesenSCG-928-N14]
MKRSFFSGPYVIWMVLFIVVPLFIVMYYGLTVETSDGVAFSLDNVARAVEPQNLGILWRSVKLALIATALCLAIGYPVALILTSKNFSKGQLVIMLFIIPMWMNFLLRTYAMVYLLDDGGLLANFLRTLGFQNVQLIYNQFAIIVGLVYNYLPFMILPLYTVMSKIDRDLISAAEDLGANSQEVFRRVRFPLSVPGIITGITMVFVPGVTTFAISRLLGGSTQMMYGELIEMQFLLTRDWHFGATLSLVMMVLIIISMVILRKTDADASGGMLF